MFSRRDDIMTNMARGVNLMEHDRQQEAKKEISHGKRRAGIIAFWCVLAFIALIVLLFFIV